MNILIIVLLIIGLVIFLVALIRVFGVALFIKVFEEELKELEEQEESDNSKEG